MRAGRSDGDLAGIVPVGADELTALVERHIDSGLSKFVLRPLDPGARLDWLAAVVLPMPS